MIRELRRNDELALYKYFITSRKNVPYYFPVNFRTWRESMFHDDDDEGNPMFAILKTYLLMGEGRVKGFIQFGLTSFVFDKRDKKDYTQSYAVIRNVHYDVGDNRGVELFDVAHAFFEGVESWERRAFFQLLGMSCYAGQGELHDSEFYLEVYLSRYGFLREQENVYYSKDLRGVPEYVDSDVEMVHSGDGRSVAFYKEKGVKEIGGCELYLAPNKGICFMESMRVNEEYSHQGLAAKCMNKLLYELSQKGVGRMDVNTATTNISARNFYLGLGFVDMGRTRSYRT